MEQERNYTDFLIIGAGPAGIQLGYYLQKKGLNYLILEGSDKAGSFFETFPRHRTLISINKRFTRSDNHEFKMRHDWNSLLTDGLDFTFRDYDMEFFPNADNLVRYINDYVERYAIRIAYNARVKKLSKHDKLYQVSCEDGTVYSAKAVVVATGFSKPYVPAIPGIEHAENYVDMSIDRREFEGKRVLIIGKGNSGFETADHLVSAAAMIHVVSPRSLTMAWKSHYVGDLRAVNNNFLDTYQLKSENAVLDANVANIEKIDGRYRVSFSYNHADGEQETIDYDRVLCCTGFKIDTAIFDESSMPELTIRGKYPQLSNEFESVNQKNLFFAGTLTHSLDYRKATSGFIHGFRYNSKALAYILDHKYRGAPWPTEIVEYSVDAIVDKVLARINRAGGIWQQPGFMADCFYRNGDGFEYATELPKDYFVEHTSALSGNVYVLTMEYGDKIEGDPFAVERIHRDDVDRSARSQFLHPVVRCYRQGNLVDEHHIIEDLEANWVEEVHRRPLHSFIDRLMDQEREQLLIA